MEPTKNRAGRTLKSERGYVFFSPSDLQDIVLKPDPKRDELVWEASRLEGKLEVSESKIPDKNLFVAMQVQREALVSSQIEGTQATLEDILCRKDLDSPNPDVEEVVNYVKALNEGKELLKSFPLCLRFIKSIHATLMSGVKGRWKTPGEFRKSQNWIGQGNSNLLTASYIPPSPEIMTKKLYGLESYLQQEDHTSPFVKAALIHYQFETIHPFLDGNGRTGRLLIPLYLFDKGQFGITSAYPSLYYKRNQAKYYGMLSKVRLTGDYESWVDFFLEGLVASMEDSLKTIDELSLLRKSVWENILAPSTPRFRESLAKILGFFYEKPFSRPSEIAAGTGLSRPTSGKAINFLLEKGVLTDLTPARERNPLLAFGDYIRIFEKGTEGETSKKKSKARQSKSDDYEM